MKTKSIKRKLTAVSAFHYFRLVFRGSLFLIGVVYYISVRMEREMMVLNEIYHHSYFLMAVWLIFVIEMLMRFFPSNLESPGCQKQFARNYVKTGKTEIRMADNNATFLVALIWVTLNAVFGFLRIYGIFDDGIMTLICLAYSVCDMICILFFCPFQTWFLKNKCCATCRIYNWDYAMMFTPFFFVRSWYAWSLLLMSLVLMFRWEITIFRHPERFSEQTNGYLTCANCKEKLCSHKKQLHRLWKHLAEYTGKRVERLSIPGIGQSERRKQERTETQ